MDMQAPLNIDPQDARLAMLEHRMESLRARLATLRQTQRAQRMLLRSQLETRAVSVRLTHDEAIVLFEWLGRVQPTEQHDLLEDQAEAQVLWDLECTLAAQVVGIFSRNYPELLARARARARSSAGGRERGQ